MSDSNRNTAAHPRAPSNYLFARKSIDRLRANLGWLSSAASDQSLMAGRLHLSPEVATELSEISARLESISSKIEVAL